MTDKQIEADIKFWKEVFGLGEWEIDYYIADCIPEGSDGSCEINPSLLHGRIWINRECGDVPGAIVHEMIHFLLPTWMTSGGAEHCDKEQSIIKLERAFCKIRGQADDQKK